MSGSDATSPSISSVSRPIPIQRSRTNGGSERNSPSSNFAQSCPAPQAPIIGSMRAPSMLQNRMPGLELPPPSPGASSFGISRNYAQSAPSHNFLLSSKKPILHALQIRRRSDSLEDKVDSSHRKTGPSSFTSRTTISRRVSWDDENMIHEEEEEYYQEEEEEEEEYLGADTDELMEPSSMEVFSAIRSIAGSLSSNDDDNKLDKKRTSNNTDTTNIAMNSLKLDDDDGDDDDDNNNNSNIVQHASSHNNGTPVGMKSPTSGNSMSQGGEPLTSRRQGSIDDGDMFFEEQFKMDGEPS